jgi:hypothetical protein
MISFMQWLMEVGGMNGGGDIPKQCPDYSAIRKSNLNRLINPNDPTTQNSDLPPTEIKYGKDRYLMKKKMKS